MTSDSFFPTFLGGMGGVGGLVMAMVLLCSPGWPLTSYSPGPVLGLLGFQACTVTPSLVGDYGMGR